MLDERKEEAFCTILREELQLATGCTEPIAVAYCAARLRQVLGQRPCRILAEVSGNILKNVKSVVVPNTGGRRGLPAAIAVGMVAGDPEARLQVIAHVTEADAPAIGDYLDSTDIRIDCPPTPRMLDIRLTGWTGDGHRAVVHVANNHTNIIYVERDGEVLLEKPHSDSAEDNLQDKSVFKYFLKRLAQMLVTLFIVSILVFVLANFIGDPVNMLVSPKAPPEVREQVREELGLNRPILEQYVSFVTNAVKGDFGKSYIYKVDVLSLIAQRVPATLELVFVSVVLALVISIPLGVYAGAFPKRKSSTLVMGGSILGISLPSFFIGIMLIYIFSLKLHWFPSSGRGATAPFLGMNFSLFAPGGLKYIILPAFTLSVTNIASLVRLTRAGVMENMRQDYIKFARAKGVSTRKVLFGHALKNALIPVITVFGMEIGSLIAFTTVTETIFSWPGLGKLLIDSINSVDRPVIVAYLILTTVLFVFINFVVDLLYTVIDPRIQFR